MSRKNAMKVLLGFVMFVWVSAGFTAETFASKESIVSKAAFESVRECYKSGAFRAWFYASKPEQVMLKNGKKDTAKFPYGWTSAKENNLNCKDLMLGGDGFGGLIPKSAMNAQNIEAVKDYFTKIGYKDEAVKGEIKSVAKKVTYTISNHECSSGNDDPTFNGNKTIEFPTIGVTDDGKIKIIKPGDFSDGGNSYSASADCNGLTLVVGMDNSLDDYERTYSLNLNGNGYKRVTYSYNGKELKVIADNVTISNQPNDGSYINLTAEVTDENVSNEEVTDYKLTAPFWAGMMAGMRNNNAAGYTFEGPAQHSSMKLTKQELFDLYTYYVKNVFGAKFVKEGNNDYEGVEVNLCKDVKYKVNKTNAKPVENVYGIDSSWYFNTPVTLDNVITMLNSKGSYEDIDNGNMCSESASGGSSITDSPATAEGIVDCNALKEVGPTQWFMCPAMNGMQYTANALDNWVDKQLEVDPGLYDMNGDSGGSKVYTAWEYIRNIANVLMVVFLLIIVFSQLTGYGIDNYGIKKMLPRLIVMAIIVNLSYYICVLAIDLSNILGVGLRNMFGSLGLEVVTGDDSDSLSFLGGMIAAVFGIGGSVGLSAADVAVTLATLTGGLSVIAIVIAVVVALVLILIAILTLFVMLGIRQILVIICLLLAPLAFVSYVLPNTQKMFRNWWNLFEACLVIFPLCGLFSGISYLLKATVGDGGGLTPWAALVMMVLPYAVFFLLPMLLKSALSALGKVGGALSAMGGTFKSGAQNLAKAGMKVGQNTDRFKDWRAMQQEKNAQRTIDKVNKMKKPSPRAAKRAYDAQMQLNKTRLEQEMARQGAVVPTDAAIEARATASREAQEFKNYEDQYKSFSRTEVGDELSSAIVAYNNDRSDGNRLRLQAVLAEAERLGMDKELLSEKTGLTGLKLSTAGSPNDMKLLNQLARSNNVILSQFGKQMGKLDGDNVVKDMGIKDFVEGVDGDDDDAITLKNALKKKGAASLNGANDDILEYIADTNIDAVDTQTLVTAAINATDDKQLSKISSIFKKRANAGIKEKYNVSVAELGRLKAKTIDAIQEAKAGDILNNAINTIRNNPNSAANQQVLNSMEDEAKTKLGLDDESMAQARGMQVGYATKTASDVALDENVEFDRRNAERRERAALTDTINRLGNTPGLTPGPTPTPGPDGGGPTPGPTPTPGPDGGGPTPGPTPTPQSRDYVVNHGNTPTVQTQTPNADSGLDVHALDMMEQRMTQQQAPAVNNTTTTTASTPTQTSTQTPAANRPTTSATQVPAGTPTITAKQMSQMNSVELSRAANRAANAGLGSREHNDFVNAAHKLAGDVADMSMLSDENREIIHRVLQQADKNDVRFANPNAGANSPSRNGQVSSFGREEGTPV